VSVKLYSIPFSHPARAVRSMLDFKGIDYDLVNFPAGMHPAALRLAGFRGRTVPALKLDGRRLQGSLQISREIEAMSPDPPLFPPERRAAVEEAEAWGERELQPIPRRFFRWGVAHRPAVARWLAGRAGMPAPAVVGVASMPIGRWFAHLSRATEENTRAGVARVPELIDHVDALIADGTIGRPGEPTAADFQIASSVAVLRSFSDIKPAIEGRPASDLVDQLFPRRLPELPPFLPEEWLGPVRG
jgi:glutathione S-transferase